MGVRIGGIVLGCALRLSAAGASLPDAAALCETDPLAARRETLRARLTAVAATLPGALDPDTLRAQAGFRVETPDTASVREAPAGASRRRTSLTGWPAVAVIRFYQTQIRTALGRRCSMQPSCSAYALEACRRYGFVGVAMAADRLVREPDHVSRHRNPVSVQGETRFADPVDDHTFWFRRYRAGGM